MIQVSLSTCLVESSMGQESLSHILPCLKNSHTITNKSKWSPNLGHGHVQDLLKTKLQTCKRYRNKTCLCRINNCILQHTFISKISIACWIFPCWRLVVATHAVTTPACIMGSIQTSPPKEDNTKMSPFRIQQVWRKSKKKIINQHNKTSDEYLEFA